MDILIILPFLLLLLAGGHAVADYGQQSAYVAEFKVRTVRGHDADGSPVRKPNPDWFVTLGAHCLIHAVVVGVIAFATLASLAILQGISSLRAAVAVASVLGWLEFGLHFAIDDAKGRERFSYRTDQALHYGCKIIWVAVILAVAAGASA